MVLIVLQFHHFTLQNHQHLKDPFSNQTSITCQWSFVILTSNLSQNPSWDCSTSQQYKESNLNAMGNISLYLMAPDHIKNQSQYWLSKSWNSDHLASTIRKILSNEGNREVNDRGIRWGHDTEQKAYVRPQKYTLNSHQWIKYLILTSAWKILMEYTNFQLVLIVILKRSCRWNKIDQLFLFTVNWSDVSTISMCKPKHKWPKLLFRTSFHSEMDHLDKGAAAKL